MDIVKEALWWAEAGVPVFPCNRRKRPMTSNGHLDASTDPDVVKAMFLPLEGSNALIGARMGEESGLFCVDVDLYKLNGSSAWYEQMKAEGNLPPTRTHETMNGGVHLIYRSETEWPNMKAANSIDVKGEGGYIIVPPSKGYTVSDDRPATTAPKGLLKALATRRNAAKADTLSDLKQRVLEASDFHESLTRIAAKLSGQGVDKIDVMKVLLDCMNASVASNTAHPRHDRWANIMGDDGKELSRIVGTGYEKYNAEAVREQAGGVFDNPELRAFADAFGFTSPDGGDTTPSLPALPDVAPDDWDDPLFAKEGFFAHHNFDVLDQEHIMYPLLGVKETVIMSATPKAGKTAVSVTMGLHIACGMDLGPSLKVPNKAGVVYYGLEGVSAIQKRIEAWKAYQVEQGIELPDKIPMFIGQKSKNLLKEEIRGYEAQWLVLVDQFFRNKIDQPLGLVVIDTFTKAMPGGDQNSAEVTSSVFDIVSKARDAGLECAFMFIHHASKHGEGPRGSTNILAEADMSLTISKKGRDIAVKIDKARSVEEGGSFIFQVHDRLLGESKQGFEMRAPVLTAKDAAETPKGKNVSEILANTAFLDEFIKWEAGSYDLETVLNLAIDCGIEFKTASPRRGRKTLPKWNNAVVQLYFEELIPETGYVYKGKSIERTRNNAGNISHLLLR